MRQAGGVAPRPAENGEPTLREPLAVNIPAGIAALRGRLAPHMPGLGVVAVVTVWTMRRFLLTTGIPAGTDMLGFVSRAAQNASTNQLVDAWSTSSFGARRIFGFDNILGGLTLLTRNPMASVKLLDALTLFAAGLAAYMLAWSWNKRRLVATTTGVLYMASQASLTHWGSGMLNIEIIISLAPLMLLTWSSCLHRFVLSRAVAFTLVIGIGVLIRADQVLYIALFLALYAVVVLATRKGLRTGLWNMARTLLVGIPGVLLLNAAWLVPSLSGYRAQYETLNQIFSFASLSTRSLDFYQSLLGFGREIGYFGFTGTETWFSYPWLPLWAYYTFASLVPILAYAALRWHRDRRTIFLAVASVLATLLAAGSRPPFGGLYLWAARNIPIFGNLRDPNRWLIVQALAYALLASLTIERAATMASGLRPRHARRISGWTLSSAEPVAIVSILMAAALVPVLPTLVIGLRTWHVTGPQQAILSQVRAAPGAGRVASIPFDQDYRFVAQGTYQGYEHDLGYESSLFTGKPDIGDGSWEQRSADFVAYEADLLAEGDPAFVSLLASAGVNRVMNFRYPLVAPQLLGNGIGPYSQQRILSKLPGLTPLLSNSAGTDYAVQGAAAPLTLKRNIAVVLGGSQGIAALADRPGLKLSDWAVFTADDVIETRGYPELLTLMRKADVVLLANERPTDIAVEGTNPLAKPAGITSDAQLDRLETDVPTDQSAQAGSLDDLTSPIPQPESTSSTSTVSVRSPRRIQVWARVLATPFAASVHASVDGKQVGTVTPVTPGKGGFEWLRLATVRLAAGTHQVTLSATPSRFGDDYEVQEARVLGVAALQSAEQRLNRTLTENSSRVAYDFNLTDAAKWSRKYLAHIGPTKGPDFSRHAWTLASGANTAVTYTAAPGGKSAPQFFARTGRAVYTVTKINYLKPRNWANSPYIYLKFKGSASGKAYQAVFDLGHGYEARYVIHDISSRWRTLAFSTSHPGIRRGRADWSRVHSVRIALPSKSESGRFALGVPRPAKSVTRLGLPLPILPGTGNFGKVAAKSSCGHQAHAFRWNASTTALVLPVSILQGSCSIYAGPRTSYRQLPATPVTLHRNGSESWSYSFSSSQPGVLVWTQAYDPLWRLSEAGSKGAPTPVLSLLDGYFVGGGSHAGSIAFTGGSSTRKGVAITVATFLFLALLPLIRVLYRRWRARDEPEFSDETRPMVSVGSAGAPPRPEPGSMRFPIHTIVRSQRWFRRSRPASGEET